MVEASGRAVDSTAQESNTYERMRIAFCIGEPIRYIAHLDLLRVWERVLRRAGLPLAYSQGFNPHPKLTIAMPLPVGCTSECEELDMVLDEPLSGMEVLSRLRPALPPGLEVISATEIDLRAPARPAQVRQADYQAVLVGIAHEDVSRRVEELIGRERADIEFHGKAYDLRPLIAMLEVKPCKEAVVLDMRLLRDEQGRIGRPDVVLSALKLSEYARQVHRRRIVFQG